MIISLIFKLYTHYFKETYIRRFAILFELISIVVGLTIYYYTSQTFQSAITTSLSQYKVDYFSYMVYGEILLAVPLYFIEGPFRNLQNYLYNGFFETLQTLPISQKKIFFVLSTEKLFQHVLRAIMTFFIAWLIFDLKILSHNLLILFALQILAIPSILAIGLVMCACLLLFGRGNSLLGYISSFMAILSGAFFPITVLPSWIQSASQFLLPTTILLESGRHIITGSSEVEILKVFALLSIWGVLLLPFSILTIKFALRYRKKIGGPIILSF